MQVGDQFTLTADVTARRADGYGGRTFHSGMIVRVTRVNTDTVMIRGHFPGRGEFSGLAYIDQLSRSVEVDPNAPKARSLGDVPEGGISPDDPHLKWLWEDAAKLAQQRGYCQQYDALCNALGIPGRPRNRKVTITIGKVKMTGSFMATSAVEANAMFRAELEEQGIAVPGATESEVVDA